VRWVGRPLPRYEDPVLLQGRGRYTADLAQGARILRFIRSQVARGRILAVNVPPEVPIIAAAVLGDVKPICPRLDRPDYVAIPSLRGFIDDDPCRPLVAAGGGVGFEAVDRVRSGRHGVNVLARVRMFQWNWRSVMRRRIFGRELKIEGVKLTCGRGVSVAQAD